MELDYGTIVLIIRQPDPRPSDPSPLPVKQEYVPERGRPSTKIKVRIPATLSPEFQTWVTVYKKRRGLVIVEPSRKLFDNHKCLAATGVHQVHNDCEFRFVVVNF